MLLPLPIDEVLPQIVAELRRADALVLRAPTGAGKTTRVPPAMFDQVVKDVARSWCSSREG